jgi:hypothetical protein
MPKVKHRHLTAAHGIHGVISETVADRDELAARVATLTPADHGRVVLCLSDRSYHIVRPEGAESPLSLLEVADRGELLDYVDQVAQGAGGETASAVGSTLPEIASWPQLLDLDLTTETSRPLTAGRNMIGGLPFRTRNIGLLNGSTGLYLTAGEGLHVDTGPNAPVRTRSETGSGGPAGVVLQLDEIPGYVESKPAMIVVAMDHAADSKLDDSGLALVFARPEFSENRPSTWPAAQQKNGAWKDGQFHEARMMRASGKAAFTCFWGGSTFADHHLSTGAPISARNAEEVEYVGIKWGDHHSHWGWIGRGEDPSAYHHEQECNSGAWNPSADTYRCPQLLGLVEEGGSGRRHLIVRRIRVYQPGGGGGGADTSALEAAIEDKAPVASVQALSTRVDALEAAPDVTAALAARAGRMQTIVHGSGLATLTSDALVLAGGASPAVSCSDAAPHGTVIVVKKVSPDGGVAVTWRNGAGELTTRHLIAMDEVMMLVKSPTGGNWSLLLHDSPLARSQRVFQSAAATTMAEPGGLYLIDCSAGSKVVVLHPFFTNGGEVTIKVDGLAAPGAYVEIDADYWPDANLPGIHKSRLIRGGNLDRRVWRISGNNASVRLRLHGKFFHVLAS